MCRSDPHTPVASIRTTASVGSFSSGSGTSSTRTSPGAWKVTARMGAHPRGPARVYAARMSEPSKAVLITGCSSGIGRATALALVRSGWTGYATARRPETLAGLEQAGCKTLALDVTDETSMQAAVPEVERAEG